MFRFGSVEFLLGLLVLPVMVVFFWTSMRARRNALEQFGDLDLVRRLSASVSPRGRLAKGILVLGAVGLSVLALARPQFGTRVETVRSQGQDILVAIDVSLSMMAEDVKPNRLERAKLEVSRMLDLLDGDRLGLVAFAGDAFVQSPLTVDYGASAMFLAAMEPDLIPIQGTNLGEALSVALDAFEEGSGDHRTLIVITDGEDHEGEIGAGVDRALEMGVNIYTVGIGSTDGVPIPEIDEAGRRSGFKRDEDGNVITTRLDEATLIRVAEATGGRYFRAGEPGALDPLLDEILRGEGRELESREVTRFEEQFQIFLGLALMMLLAESVVPDRRRVKHVWTGRFR
ncbi:MAG: VWA domain-containing protein [Gemmatimonadetes bacterium]|nr:VWA domain-containing protein [Gemmatimonadota bacterium]